MKTIELMLSDDNSVTLTCYLQKVSSEYSNVTKRPAMIVLPGGGYQYCSDREADPVAFAYLKAGYQVFILRYSVGEKAVWPKPLEDYEKAYETILANSDEWQIDPSKIAVIGFSAGGHLAAAAATVSKYHPAACILGYPVITEETTHIYCKTAPGIPENVDGNTSPCFVFSTRTDTTVPIDNTIRLIDALTQNGVSYECHIYAYANHGFTTCDSSVQNREWICSRTPDWVEDSLEWLKDIIGDFRNGTIDKRNGWY